jgi:predicted nucleic acid-binding protein
LILVDANVLIDILTSDMIWASWSEARLDAARARSRLGINPVVYAELAVPFPKIELLDEFLTDIGVLLLEVPRPALFLAGKVFRDHRRRGGHRTGVLPDFFIGAHAAVAALPLLTRDTGRYRTWFPTVVELIAPDR